jgi:hypothetical protein
MDNVQLEEADDLLEGIDATLEKFKKETQQLVLHEICYYWGDLAEFQCFCHSWKLQCWNVIPGDASLSHHLHARPSTLAETKQLNGGEEWVQK